MSASYDDDGDDAFYVDILCDVIKMEPSSPKKYCLECRVTVIPDTVKYLFCKACYLKRKKDQGDMYPNGRSCCVCHRRRIPEDSPPYVTKCITCYRSTSTTEEYRPCTRCHKMKIRRAAPDTHALCHTCYFKK